MMVLKFGGSSVDSAAGILRVVELIRARLPARPVVVVSAMAKTTRRLVAAGEAAAGDLGTARAIAAEIADFHRRAAEPVTPPGSLEPIFATYFQGLDEALADIANIANGANIADADIAGRGTAGALAPRDEDRVASFGELLSSAILTLALARAGVAATCVDCRRVIVTDDQHTHARPEYPATDARLQAALQPLLAAGGVPVLGGYVGATREGVTTTLGREGSDFSAAIVGAALGAEEVQLWTDVDGILSADPQIVPGARVVPTLSFGEALELACSGSKKPHPGAIEPARCAGVPIRVLNSRNPGAGGTLIGRRAALDPPHILSLACRTAAYPLYTLDGRPPAPPVAPGRALLSLISEDLATYPALAERTLAAARAYDPGPRLETEAADTAAPAVRLLVDEAEAPRVLAELHAALILG
jgi:aspartate kinase